VSKKMAEKKRKIVKVNFVGKEALEGKVFDTTSEEEAKKAGIHDARRKYEPLTIITGEKELLEKVEDVIEQMKEGEKQLVKLISNEAFGERKQELVRVIPIKNFFDQKINPFPGLVVRVANAIGKVQSVTSGRVRIDFNHPLAGRDVEYHVELVKEIKDNKEVAEAIFEKYYERIPGSKKEITPGVLTVTLSKNLMKNLEQVNKSITQIAKEFGVELKFKEEEMVGSEVELPKEISEENHVHTKNCNHEHLHEKKEPTQENNHATQESGSKEKTKSIHQIADEAKQKTKKEFEVSKDNSTTIQRPLKK
jgi:FKBP-type peptidyl-prolyl cis-trans isomerase 2